MDVLETEGTTKIPAVHGKSSSKTALITEHALNQENDDIDITFVPRDLIDAETAKKVDDKTHSDPTHGDKFAQWKKDADKN